MSCAHLWDEIKVTKVTRLNHLLTQIEKAAATTRKLAQPMRIPHVCGLHEALSHPLSPDQRQAAWARDRAEQPTSRTPRGDAQHLAWTATPQPPRMAKLGRSLPLWTQPPVRRQATPNPEA